MANIVQLKNISATDLNLSLSQALPAAGASVTTGYIDMQAVGPNSDAWTDGVFAIGFPALPENIVAAGITVTMQVAGPNLTQGATAIAPNTSGPGAFAAPATAQVATLAGIAATGTPATKLWLELPLDTTGSPYQFYQFVIAVTAGINTTGEVITIAWEDRS
jgi:hypothetical protein